MKKENYKYAVGEMMELSVNGEICTNELIPGPLLVNFSLDCRGSKKNTTLKALHLYIHITGCYLCVDFWIFGGDEGGKRNCPPSGSERAGSPRFGPWAPICCGQGLNWWPRLRLGALLFHPA